MKIKELKNKSAAELQTLLTESRLKLKELRFKDANKQLKDVREIRESKRLIAQLLTLLKQTTKEVK